MKNQLNKSIKTQNNTTAKATNNSSVKKAAATKKRAGKEIPTNSKKTSSVSLGLKQNPAPIPEETIKFVKSKQASSTPSKIAEEHCADSSCPSIRSIDTHEDSLTPNYFCTRSRK